MKYLLGEDWQNLFDVVIVSARKPNFFKAKSKHFRIYSPERKRLKWKPVLSLEQGLVYTGVNILQGHTLGREILYKEKAQLALKNLKNQFGDQRHDS